VTFINQVGERHLVPSVVPKEGEATRNWNLTRWGGQAGAVEIEPISRAGDGGLSSALEWRNLRVEEVRRRGLAGADFPRQQYNVIVILLDSLRPDYLASYGNQEVDSRGISKLSRYGVTFDDAQSNSSWTRPSVASMFTSALPWVHQADEINSKLRSDISYLPEILNQAGYRTECAIGTAMVSEGFGFDRGYDRVHNLWDTDEHRLPTKPVRRAEVLWKYYLEPLTKGDQPYFFFLHEVDPHSPYTPFGRFRPDLSTPLPRRIVTGRSHEIAQIRSNPDGITATELELMKGLYAGEVSGMDTQIGALLKQADAANALENTLVIFVSDHGEEFLDHRSAGHGHSVYRELLRVPLIMRLDRVFIRGLRVAAPVELRDIAPTVLDLVGIDIPADMDGRSLVHLLAGGRFSDSRPVMASSGKPLLYSIRFGAMKLITPPPSSNVINEKAQLFNVYADPNEQTNIINRFPIVREALHQTLRAHLDLKFGVTEREYADISDEMRENLKALGYLEK
jgi:arylsulfatase A-like enzyme